MNKSTFPEDPVENSLEYTKLFYIHVPKTEGNYITKVALRKITDPLSGEEKSALPGWLTGGKKNAVRLINGGHCVCTKKPLNTAKYNRAWTKRCSSIRGMQGFLVFSAVRNPFDPLVSMYTYGYPYRRPKPEKPKPGLYRIGFLFTDFEEWIRTYCNPQYPWLVDYQHRFRFFQLFDDCGICVPQYTLRTETLDAGLEWLMKPFEIIPKVSPNRVNPSRKDKQKDYRTSYTDELREQVEKKCSRKLQAPSYTFDGHDGRTFIDPSNIHYNPHTDDFSTLNFK